MRVNLIYLLILTFFAINANGQTPNKIKSIKLTTTAKSVSIDRQGNFYIATNRGEIDKYSLTGDLLYHFSPQRNANVTLIEAWQGPRVFGYYKDFQEYIILDRFLSNSKQYSLSNGLSSFSTIATLSGDGNLWLIDSKNLSLQKINILSDQVMINTPFNLNLELSNYDFYHIREYQNQLFISDPKQGLLVFDLFGNYSGLIEAKGIDYFSFFKNELIFLQGTKAVLINIYDKKRREIELADLSYNYVLMENSILICIADSRIDLYQIN